MKFANSESNFESIIASKTGEDQLKAIENFNEHMELKQSEIIRKSLEVSERIVLSKMWL